MVIENVRPSHTDLVDKVYIPITKNSFSESEDYLGMYGIAEMILGYCYIVPNQVSSAITAQQGQ